MQGIRHRSNSTNIELLQIVRVIVTNEYHFAILPLAFLLDDSDSKGQNYIDKRSVYEVYKLVFF